MKKAILNVSEYHTMWLFAMFDLPVKTREDRREYARFRKALLANGFCMLQYSVYARYCPNEEASEVYRKKVEALVPEKGQVRVLGVTEHQFGKMQVFYGKKRQPTEKPPLQLMLF